MGNTQQDPTSCLVHPVDHFDNVFVLFLVKSMQHLSEKAHFGGFLFPQVVQKHKVCEVGK